MNRSWPSDPQGPHNVDVLIRRAHRWRTRVMKGFARFLFRSGGRLARQAVGNTVRLAHRIVSNLVQRWQQKAAVAALMGAGDRTLKDLGIPRSQIHALVHGLDVSHPRQNATPPAAGPVSPAAEPNPLAVAGHSAAGRRQVIRGR